MAKISFNIRDVIYPECLNEFCRVEGYQDLVPDGNGGFMQNPKTKDEFAEQRLRRMFKEPAIAAAKNARIGAVMQEEEDRLS